MNTVKRQKRTVGSIIKIDLGSGYHTYGRILPEISFAFYDCKVKEDIADLNKIISLPILFIASVYGDTITKGIWTKVGTLPLEPDLYKLPSEFIQDTFNPEKFRIINYQLNTETPAKFEDCIGMERVCVWEPHGIVDRLNDYYENRIKDRLEYFDIEKREPKEMFKAVPAGSVYIYEFSELNEEIKKRTIDTFHGKSLYYNSENIIENQHFINQGFGICYLADLV